MNKELTELVIVIDRSGSMSNMAEEVNGAINRLIDEQKALPGECRVTLVQFDDIYEVVHDNVDIRNVLKYTCIPRGSTALLDAVGKAINTVGERLAKTPENQRPGLVSVIIATDGMNNASKEFTLEQIKEMVTRQQEVYKWHFNFLGAQIDAYAASYGMNFAHQNVSNVGKGKFKNAVKYYSGKLGATRGKTRDGEIVTSNAFAYTAAEKADLENS